MTAVESVRSESGGSSASTAPMEIQAYDLEARKPSDEISRELKQVMSNPKHVEELEALAQKLSHKGGLRINPEDFDLVKTLGVIAKRFDEHGFPAKYTGVTFKDLSSSGIDIGASYWPSVSEIGYGIASIPSSLFKKKTGPKHRKIINNVNGIVKPGELLLVLGRPGAGCSSLLKTVAGEIDQFTGVEGDLRYDGASLEEMQKNFKREVIYNPERM